MIKRKKIMNFKIKMLFFKKLANSNNVSIDDRWGEGFEVKGI